MINTLSCLHVSFHVDICQLSGKNKCMFPINKYVYWLCTRVYFTNLMFLKLSLVIKMDKDESYENSFSKSINPKSKKSTALNPTSPSRKCLI